MPSAPASELDQLAFSDLVLRRLAYECPSVEVDMVRAVDFEARVLVRHPVRLPVASAFEMTGPRVVALPRTRRSLMLAAEATEQPLPAMIPFVSAASSHAVTVAGAGASGCVVSAAVAERAMQLHWLAPWGRGEIESVATWPGSGCQRTMGPASPVSESTGGEGPERASSGTSPVGYLVFTDESGGIDTGFEGNGARWAGARVGVVRSADLGHPARSASAPSASAARSAPRPPLRVGDTEYVLVDTCP